MSNRFGFSQSLTHVIAPSHSPHHPIQRGKRRNDMMAKSPSPRASLCATVSRQTSKKSRTAAAAAAKDTASNAANAATNASSRRSRRSSEQVTNGT